MKSSWTRGFAAPAPSSARPEEKRLRRPGQRKEGQPRLRLLLDSQLLLVPNRDSREEVDLLVEADLEGDVADVSVPDKPVVVGHRRARDPREARRELPQL